MVESGINVRVDRRLLIASEFFSEHKRIEYKSEETDKNEIICVKHIKTILFINFQF